MNVNVPFMLLLLLLLLFLLLLLLHFCMARMVTVPIIVSCNLVIL